MQSMHLIVELDVTLRVALTSMYIEDLVRVRTFLKTKKQLSLTNKILVINSLLIYFDEMFIISSQKIFCIKIFYAFFGLI